MPKKSRIPGGKQFYRRIINIKYQKFQKCTIKAQIALYVFRRSFFSMDTEAKLKGDTDKLIMN